MIRSVVNRRLMLSMVGVLLVGSEVRAEFLSDSKASLMIRNYYFNKDFRQDNAAQSHADEWAQGFWLKYESGFTEGPIGFGLDATGMWGIRLDSGKGRSGTGILPVHKDGDVPGEYGKMGATAKVRFAKTVLRYGTLFPMMPTLSPNQTRLFPQYFRGFSAVSQDIEHLTVHAGRLTDSILRNSTAGKNISMTNKGVTGINPSDRFNYAGLKYQWSPSLSTSYDYAHLNNNYKQSYFTLDHRFNLSEGQSISSDLRYAHSTDDGDTNVDNKAIGAMFTYKVKAHSVSLAYQKMVGETGFAYVAGSDPYLVNFAQVNDFANPNEKSWQARYTYDFAALGIPGLSLMTRYIKGTNFHRADGSRGREWERDIYVDYQFQAGPLKNLLVQWRNATMRSDGNGNDLDENRLILTYTLPLL